MLKTGTKFNPDFEIKDETFPEDERFETIPGWTQEYADDVQCNQMLFLGDKVYDIDVVVYEKYCCDGPTINFWQEAYVGCNALPFAARNLTGIPDYGFISLEYFEALCEANGLPSPLNRDGCDWG